MAPKTFLLAFVIVLFAVFGRPVAASEATEQEYQQVRKIALRDPKVQGAYEEADRKLEEKILQIDPALADYLHRRSTEPFDTPEAKKAEPHIKPAAAPPAPPATSPGTTYLVKKGDTLGAIASHYNVTVAALKAANHIADEKKLAVGQELKIPQH